MPRGNPDKSLAGGPRTSAPLKRKLAVLARGQMQEINAASRGLKQVATSPIKFGKAALTGNLHKIPHAKKPLKR